MARSVIVVDYDPAWPAQFDQLRANLAKALGELALAIEHVGSTSVPGLAAKPIIDIDVVIESRAELLAAIEFLAPLGYEHRGDLGIFGREAFCALHEPASAWPRHNLYVCARDNRELHRHLALRDWLRTHGDDRRRYAELERRLAAAFPHDVDGYCEAKGGLIESLLVHATGQGFCTERAVARPFWIRDLPYAHAVFSDPEVMRFSPGGPSPSEEATARRIEHYVAMQAERGFSKWAVWDRSSGAYLGDAGLTVLPETGEVELGYRLGAAHWGRGLATELARAWLDHAFGPLGLERVIAFADPRNVASVRVMEKIGMRFDRRDRLCGLDCVVYVATCSSASRLT
ncbi:MAG: bifunctional GrpB family protein/GNAT family N-acetyltransferase [Enhygromyxa sp.]